MVKIVAFIEGSLIGQKTATLSQKPVILPAIDLTN